MKHTPLLLAASALILSSCTLAGAALGVGATAGIAASQEGGLSRAVDDAAIQIAINDLWFKYSVEAFRKLDLTINNGRVLVTGVVQNPEHRVEAIRLAWQPKGVQQVINEIRVAESSGITGFAKDTWITTRLRGALTFERDVESINYSIDTVQGTVYLMGFANSQRELNRVAELARTISGVQGVVSYVQVYQAKEDFVPGGQQVAPVERQTYGSMQPAGQQNVQPSQEPIVIAPQAQYEDRSVQAVGGNDPSRPYIVRDPVQAENLRARDAQVQRVNEANKVYSQPVERENIQWNE
jgi:osmotically-inducible protein OsmY